MPPYCPLIDWFNGAGQRQGSLNAMLREWQQPVNEVTVRAAWRQNPSFPPHSPLSLSWSITPIPKPLSSSAILHVDMVYKHRISRFLFSESQCICPVSSVHHIFHHPSIISYSLFYTRTEASNDRYINGWGDFYQWLQTRQILVDKPTLRDTLKVFLCE